MKKFTFATIAASGLATVAIGLAAPAFAGPSGGGQTIEADNNPYSTSGQTPYGTYQNDDKRRVQHHD